ncbi:hypothetical protein, partial [Actinotalea sp.]|uniref:hypothetical protein n=1 Tax=Actinotalea sp. TaxID=1872145 RepID=UPI003564B9DC
AAGTTSEAPVDESTDTDESAPADDPSPTSTATSIAAEPVQEVPTGPYGSYSEAQSAFVSRVQQAQDEFDEASNDLQQSQVLLQRNNDLCSTVGSKFENWTGVITTIGANGDGNAYIEIEIADGVRVKTWNNSFSDFGDDTLIDSSSDLFQTLLSIDEDSPVVFSGEFIGDGDSCVKNSNLTETFSVIDPQFLARFTAVSPRE